MFKTLRWPSAFSVQTNEADQSRTDLWNVKPLNVCECDPSVCLKLALARFPRMIFSTLERHKDRQHFFDNIFGPCVQIKYTCRYIRMYMKWLNNLQPRHLDTVFFFFFFSSSIKKHHHIDRYTKNRNDQAFLWICSLLRADKSLNRGVPQLRQKVSLHSLLSCQFLL